MTINDHGKSYYNLGVEYTDHDVGVLYTGHDIEEGYTDQDVEVEFTDNDVGADMGKVKKFPKRNFHGTQILKQAREIKFTNFDKCMIIFFKQLLKLN